MSKTSSIAIVILAAGTSTRMGQPKQLLKWGDTNLVGHTITTAKASKAHNVIIVLGAHYEKVAESIRDDSVTIIQNKNYAEGMGTSIAYAAKFLLQSDSHYDGVLLMLADQPFVTSVHLNKMILAFQPESQDIIATSYDDDTKGVPVLFDHTYLNTLYKLSGDGGAKGIVKKYPTHLKTLKASFKNLDLDRYEVYQALYRANFKI